jgi:hypothetical protein
MKTRLNVWILGVLALLATLPAHARPGGGRFWQRFSEHEASPRFADRAAERAQRQEIRRDEAPVFGRMSPEERRQLRRDIRNAGEDIYRRPAPAFPPPDSR